MTKEIRKITADGTESWVKATAEGRALAHETVRKIRETGDLTLLASAMRTMEGDPLYDGMGAGFLIAVAAHLSKG